MLLIGFGNKARNGKDTAAEAIKGFHDSFNSARVAHGNYGKIMRVGIFKYAGALYNEVNDWLSVTKNFQPLPARYGVVQGDGDVIHIPEWVQPTPNAEVSALAPYGKHAKLLQWWGTEYRRAQDSEYWVKRLFASIPDNLDIALVTDVRFPNEAKAIEQRGGYTVNVQRLREDGTQFFDSSRPADHPSETALDGWNWNFYLKIPHGHPALLGEQAITLTEYLRGLKK